MASNLEFVNYKDFVENLPEATEFASSDKAVVSNSTNGPRRMVKIPDLQASLESISKNENDDYSFSFVDENGNAVLTIPKNGIEDPIATVFNDTFEACALVDGSESFIKTSGFYEENDGGGALYEVVVDSEIVANGMDVLACSMHNVFLKLVAQPDMRIEQVGGRPNLSFFDNGLVFNRACEIGVKTIRFQARRYYVSTTMIPLYDTKVIGDGCELYCTQDVAFRLEKRYFQIEKMTIKYYGSKPKTNRNVRAFWCENYNDGANHYMWVFKDLVVDGWGVAFRFWGSIKWYVSFIRIRANDCGLAAHITQGFNLYFNAFGINHCDAGVVLQGLINAVFVSCGLASDGGAALACISESSNDLEFAEGSECRQSIKCIACDFETDTDIDSSEATFLAVFHKKNHVDVSFDSCWFTSNKLKEGVYGIAFNDNVSATFIGNTWIYGENGSEPYLFNPDRPPMKKIGSVKYIGENSYMPKPYWGSDCKPSFVDNDNVIHCDSIESIEENYTSNGNGTVVYDDSADKLFYLSNGIYKEI